MYTDNLLPGVFYIILYLYTEENGDKFEVHKI